MKASSLFGRRDYGAAAAIYEGVVSRDPANGFAAFMLATCYEHEQRMTDALHWAEAAARALPNSLAALQSATRLSIASGDHEKATGYVLRSLALPEVMTEMRREALLPKPVMWFFWALDHTPFRRKRLRPDPLVELQPGSQAIQLQRWKEWSRVYLAWRSGNDGAPPRTRPH